MSAASGYYYRLADAPHAAPGHNCLVTLLPDGSWLAWCPKHEWEESTNSFESALIQRANHFAATAIPS